MYPRLAEGTLRELNQPYKEEEICLTLKGIGGWKAPRLDGLHAAIWQKSWKIAGKSVSSSTIKILEGEKLPQGMAKVLLVLIPNLERPESIHHFCPISLSNVTFKLVTKVIVNKLKQVMEELVSPNQSSFVPHRQISDNIIICQELIDTRKHKVRRKGWYDHQNRSRESLWSLRVETNHGDSIWRRTSQMNRGGDHEVHYTGILSLDLEWWMHGSSSADKGDQTRWSDIHIHFCVMHW